MNIRKEKGVTGIDISIAIVVLFIFVSLIASLIYNYNVSVKESTRKTQALNLAIDEIEKVKKNGFSKYEKLDKNSTQYNNDGTKIENNQSIAGNEGFFKTIKITDYTDIKGNENEQKDIVKRVTVIISYNSKGESQEIELSTLLTKENE